MMIIKAPGSQNGFDNSGLRDQIGWQSTPGYVEHTKGVIASLAKKYAQPQYNNVVTAIELLNERELTPFLGES